MSIPSTGDSIRDRLDEAVPQALREDDEAALEAAQQALAAIESAEADAHDRLTEADLLAIVVDQAVAREDLADRERSAGRDETADRLVTQAIYLREFTA